MKTDKIFYTLFQVFPELLFQLIGESGESAELAQNYQFQSIEIKELAFRLDGVFIPDENRTEIFIYLKQYKQ